MVQETQNSRRSFIRQSAGGAAALGIGIATFATLTESCNNPNDKNKRAGMAENSDSMSVAAKQEGNDSRGREYFSNIIPIVSLSNKMCDIAQNKANGKYVKEFAKFELEETDTVKKVIKEMGIDEPAMDANGQAKLDKLKSLSGAEFDRMFIQEQIDGHKKLIDHADMFLNGAGKEDAEIHNRHIAMMARATHKEHVTICNRLMEEGMKA